MELFAQQQAKDNLKVFIEAAKMRKEALDHVLLYGPPGLGKTTLSQIIANELGVSIRTTSGPAIERPGDLAAILTNLQEGDVLFIDEMIDNGLDTQGVESALALLKQMSRERHKSIWLVSHRDELAGRVENILKVVKEGGFTSYNTDIEVV
mgnify:CR=1 FL=1